MITYKISGEEYQAFLQYKKLIAEKPDLAAIVSNEAFWNELSTFLSLTYALKANPVPPNMDTPKRATMKRGSGKHLITFVAEDFDAPLDDFKDYM